MKKVYGGDEAFEKECDASDVENPVVGGVRRKQFNVFNLVNYRRAFENNFIVYSSFLTLPFFFCHDLKLNQNSESEAKEDDDRETSTAAGILSEDAKRKKKKKKRKKTENSKVHRTARRSSEDNEEVDEIDRTVREINKLLGEPVLDLNLNDFDHSGSGLQKSKENVLTIQHKNLNPYNELKRIFGSKTIQAEQR